MSEILWNIGEKSKVIVTLPSDTSYIPHSHTYFQDSVTEKVIFFFSPNVFIWVIQITKNNYFQISLFELTKLVDLEILLKRYLFHVSVVNCYQRQNTKITIFIWIFSSPMGMARVLCFFCTVLWWHELSPSMTHGKHSQNVKFRIKIYMLIYRYRVQTDLDAPKSSYLMGTHEEGSLNIVTLLLTGRATPYLHNGVIYVGDEDHYVNL